jgi:phage shock protein PspC (stress-responsive transcriptional regulator)
MQRIAVTARLHRSTLQFDEAAYAHLEQYLAESASLLEGDPDPQEILADLEQAVADQCTRRLRPGQTVVTLAELAPALEEIGKVQPPGAAAPSSSSPPPPPPSSTWSASAASSSLRQVSQGAVISGVCLGLARYFRLDATLLRVISVLLLFGTGGAMVLVYLSLMLLIPYAPLDPGGAPVRWLPAKCRAFMEYLRVKLGVDSPGKIAA